MNKRLFLFWGVLTGIVVLVAGGYLIWDKLIKYDPVKVHEEAQRRYIEAMTTDTYGGKTPKETLDMFVAALRSGNVELASKYFLLDENLRRAKWVSYLTDIKGRGLLSRMADDIEKFAKPVSGNDKNDYAFELLNKEGIVAVLIDMQFNQRSQLWKIESL